MRLSRTVAAALALPLLLTSCGPGGGGADAPEVDAAGPGTETEIETPTATATEDDEGEPAGSRDAYDDDDVVRLIVGQDPGGGFDTTARLLQPYLQQALREATGTNLAVIVENMAGGNNVVAAQALYAAEPDGTTLYIGSSERMVLIEVLEDANFDLSQVTPLGGLGVSNRGIVARKDLDLPEPTFEALAARSRQDRVALTTPSEQRLNLLNALLDDEGEPTEFSFVSLGGGTGGAMTAILRGDIDAVWTTAASMASFVEDNPETLQWIVSMGCERDEVALPDLETIVEEGVPNARAICTTIGSYERVFIGPPGLEGETLATLQGALETAIGNEEFVERATQAGEPPNYRTPQYQQDLFAEVSEMYYRYEDVLRGG